MGEVSTVLNYLIAVADSEEVSNMSKLAAITVLNKIFETDKDYEIQVSCLKKGIVSTLVMILDVGLVPQCDSSDLVFVNAAMETLWRLSRLPGHMIQCLISEIMIKNLLGYLDVGSEYFVFPRKFAEILAARCENRQLVGKVKVVSMGPAPLEYIHRHTNNKLKCLSKLPSTVNVCSLFDTSGASDVDLSKYMCKQDLAWEGSNFPGDLIGGDSNKWEEVLVTKVIDGGFFWAHVGEDTIKDVCSIQKQLNEGLQFERQPVSMSGDLVIIHTEIHSTSAYLRAQVIAMTGYAGQMSEVFLMDYGHILTISDFQMFVMPDYFKTIPRKISLCALEGIQAPPKDEELSINAAAVLTNIAKQGFPYAGEMICQFDGITKIEKLLQCTTSRALETRLLTLLGNMGFCKKLVAEFTKSRIIPILLEKLKAGTKEDQRPTDRVSCDEDVDYYDNCISCLANVLYRNNDTREIFYQSQGLDIILEFLRTRVQGNTRLYNCILKLLKNFIGSAAVVIDNVDPLHPGKSNSVAKISPRKEQQKESPTSSNVKKREEITERPSKGDSIPDTDRLVPLPSANTDRGIRHVDKSGMYVLGSCVYICDDQTHELHEVTQVSNISSTVIAQVICGMVNSGRGGTIYCGIDKEGIVFGFELSRDDKDRFRLGIDQLMCNKIKPALLHSNFDFKAVPVLEKDTQEVIPDLFVIEIIVRSARGVTYITYNDNCFYRYGSSTNSVNKVELRKLIAVDEEEYYRGEIDRLLKRKSQLT